MESPNKKNSADGCRKATEKDHDEIYAILKERNDWLINKGEAPFDVEYVMEDIDENISEGTAVVCMADNEVCGVLTFKDKGSFIYLKNGVTKLNHSGQGLMVKQGKYIGETYNKMLFFDVVLPNDKLLQFHKLQGSVPICIIKDDDGIEHQIMRVNF